jgi:hypothetical protein
MSCIGEHGKLHGALAAQKLELASNRTNLELFEEMSQEESLNGHWKEVHDEHHGPRL